MSTHYLPTREAELYNWGRNLQSLVAVSPAEWGLTGEEWIAYEPFAQAWEAAYVRAVEPTTRTRPTIEAKDVAKRAFLAQTRKIVRIMQASPVMTDAKRRQLAITVRDVDPTPVPVPTVSPTVVIEGVRGRGVSIRLIDAEDPTRRARPAGVDGAMIYTFAGETPPTTIVGWESRGATGRTSATLQFDAGVPGGGKVWVTAAWFNRRLQTSPLATPQGTHLAGGLARAA